MSAATKKASKPKAKPSKAKPKSNGEIQFTEVEPGSSKKAQIDQRCAKLVDLLRDADGPVLGKTLHEQLGGSPALQIPALSTLAALGLVKRYRASNGAKGLAYEWVGK